MFAVLQIRRPVLAAACLGLYVAGLMALFGAAYGKTLDDILFELPIAVAMTTAVAAAANRRARPGLTGLTAEQVRRVVRWVRHGEVVYLGLYTDRDQALEALWRREQRQPAGPASGTEG